MADAKPGLFTQLQTVFNRLTISQKVVLGAVAALTLGGIWLVSTIAGAIRYGVLYSNLPIEDSGAIVEKLKEQKIPYQVTAGGGVIKVPEDRIGEVRISLAAQGLPQGGGVGFEIFDKSSLSTTDFVQNINYVRALEGELSRSIAQIREVAFAKVHLTLPKKSVFMEEQQPAKASVILKLRTGSSLAPSAVPAIMHLCAQSVEGLVPDNIAVIDVSGRLLSRPRGAVDSFDQNASEQMSYQKKMEESYAREVIDLLEPIIGVGKVRADVRLNLDFNKVETKEERVDPEGIAKVSEQSETTSSTGAGGSGGTPGVASNVASAGGGVATSGGGSGGAKAKSEKSVVNYEVSKTITHQIRPVGQIQSLSAAVVVDHAVETSEKDGKLVRTVRPRRPEELDKLRKLVQAALGFKADRGDRVEIENISFDTAPETEGEFYAKKQKSEDLVKTLIRYGVYLVAALLLFFLVIRPAFRRVGEMFHGKVALGPSYEIPKIESEKLAQLQNMKDDAEIEKELLEQYKVPKEAKKMTIIKERVKEFAQNNPDGTASLVRSYLMEGGGGGAK